MKSKKGSVAVSARNGMLRLRWRFRGQPYQLSLGIKDNEVNRSIANQKASEIEIDILTGDFDTSLEKYRSSKKIDYSTIELFERFTHFRQLEGTSGQAIHSRYYSLAANLKRFGRNIEDEVSAREFVDLLRSRQSPRIANQNLSLLHGFFTWAIAAGYIDFNPCANIKPIKQQHHNTQKPFSRDEVTAILDAAKKDPLLRHYHDFCMVLLYLGLRPSEAIALKWEHVDLEKGQILICESLSRGADGRASGAARESKQTKTGTTRVLPLNTALRTMFAERDFGKGLIFTTTRNKPIDDHYFSQKIWKPLCNAAGVEYRPPYTARHTLISHLIEEGATMPQAAYIAGHKNTRMVAQIYGHMINMPKMPEF